MSQNLGSRLVEEEEVEAVVELDEPEPEPEFGEVAIRLSR